MYKIIPQERTLRAAGAVVIESEPIVGLVLLYAEEADVVVSDAVVTAHWNVAETLGGI